MHNIGAGRPTRLIIETINMKTVKHVHFFILKYSKGCHRGKGHVILKYHFLARES